PSALTVRAVAQFQLPSEGFGMALSDVAIRKAKPCAKPAKMADGGGLYLLLRPDGAKWWRWITGGPSSGSCDPPSKCSAACASHWLVSVGYVPACRCWG